MGGDNIYLNRPNKSKSTCTLPKPNLRNALFTSRDLKSRGSGSSREGYEKNKALVQSQQSREKKVIFVKECPHKYNNRDRKSDTDLRNTKPVLANRPSLLHVLGDTVIGKLKAINVKNDARYILQDKNRTSTKGPFVCNDRCREIDTEDTQISNKTAGNNYFRHRNNHNLGLYAQETRNKWLTSQRNSELQFLQSHRNAKKQRIAMKPLKPKINDINEIIPSKVKKLYDRNEITMTSKEFKNPDRKHSEGSLISSRNELIKKHISKTKSIKKSKNKTQAKELQTIASKASTVSSQTIPYELTKENERNNRFTNSKASKNLDVKYSDESCICSKKKWIPKHIYKTICIKRMPRNIRQTKAQRITSKPCVSSQTVPSELCQFYDTRERVIASKVHKKPADMGKYVSLISCFNTWIKSHTSKKNVKRRSCNRRKTNNLQIIACKASSGSSKTIPNKRLNLDKRHETCKSSCCSSKTLPNKRLSLDKRLESTINTEPLKKPADKSRDVSLISSLNKLVKKYTSKQNVVKKRQNSDFQTIASKESSASSQTVANKIMKLNVRNKRKTTSKANLKANGKYSHESLISSTNKWIRKHISKTNGIKRSRNTRDKNNLQTIASQASPVSSQTVSNELMTENERNKMIPGLGTPNDLTTVNDKNKRITSSRVFKNPDVKHSDESCISSTKKWIEKHVCKTNSIKRSRNKRVKNNLQIIESKASTVPSQTVPNELMTENERNKIIPGLGTPNDLTTVNDKNKRITSSRLTKNPDVKHSDESCISSTKKWIEKHICKTNSIKRMPRNRRPTLNLQTIASKASTASPQTDSNEPATVIERNKQITSSKNPDVKHSDESCISSTKKWIEKHICKTNSIKRMPRNRRPTLNLQTIASKASTASPQTDSNEPATVIERNKRITSSKNPDVKHSDESCISSTKKWIEKHICKTNSIKRMPRNRKPTMNLQNIASKASTASQQTNYNEPATVIERNKRITSSKNPDVKHSDESCISSTKKWIEKHICKTNSIKRMPRNRRPTMNLQTIASKASTASPQTDSNEPATVIERNKRKTSSKNPDVKHSYESCISSTKKWIEKHICKETSLKGMSRDRRQTKNLQTTASKASNVSLQTVSNSHVKNGTTLHKNKNSTTRFKKKKNSPVKAQQNILYAEDKSQFTLGRKDKKKYDADKNLEHKKQAELSRKQYSLEYIPSNKSKLNTDRYDQDSTDKNDKRRGSYKIKEIFGFKNTKNKYNKKLFENNLNTESRKSLHKQMSMVGGKNYKEATKYTDLGTKHYEELSITSAIKCECLDKKSLPHSSHETNTDAREYERLVETQRPRTKVHEKQPILTNQKGDHLVKCECLDNEIKLFSGHMNDQPNKTYKKQDSRIKMKSTNTILAEKQSKVPSNAKLSSGHFFNRMTTNKKTFSSDRISRVSLVKKSTKKSGNGSLHILKRKPHDHIDNIDVNIGIKSSTAPGSSKNGYKSSRSMFGSDQIICYCSKSNIKTPKNRSSAIEGPERGIALKNTEASRRATKYCDCVKTRNTKNICSCLLANWSRKKKKPSRCDCDGVSKTKPLCSCSKQTIANTNNKESDVNKNTRKSSYSEIKQPSTYNNDSVQIYQTETLWSCILKAAKQKIKSIQKPPKSQQFSKSKALKSEIKIRSKPKTEIKVENLKDRKLSPISITKQARESKNKQTSMTVTKASESNKDYAGFPKTCSCKKITKSSVCNRDCTAFPKTCSCKKITKSSVCSNRDCTVLTTTCSCKKITKSSVCSNRVCTGSPKTCSCQKIIKSSVCDRDCPGFRKTCSFMYVIKPRALNKDGVGDFGNIIRVCSHSTITKSSVSNKDCASPPNICSCKKIIKSSVSNKDYAGPPKICSCKDITKSNVCHKDCTGFPKRGSFINIAKRRVHDKDSASPPKITSSSKKIVFDSVGLSKTESSSSKIKKLNKNNKESNDFAKNKITCSCSKIKKVNKNNKEIDGFAKNKITCSCSKIKKLNKNNKEIDGFAKNKITCSCSNIKELNKINKESEGFAKNKITCSCSKIKKRNKINKESDGFAKNKITCSCSNIKDLNRNNKETDGFAHNNITCSCSNVKKLKKNNKESDGFAKNKITCLCSMNTCSCSNIKKLNKINKESDGFAKNKITCSCSNIKKLNKINKESDGFAKNKITCSCSNIKKTRKYNKDSIRIRKTESLCSFIFKKMREAKQNMKSFQKPGKSEDFFKSKRQIKFASEQKPTHIKARKSQIKIELKGKPVAKEKYSKARAREATQKIKSKQKILKKKEFSIKITKPSQNKPKCSSDCTLGKAQNSEDSPNRKYGRNKRRYRQIGGGIKCSSECKFILSSRRAAKHILIELKKLDMKKKCADRCKYDESRKRAAKQIINEMQMLAKTVKKENQPKFQIKRKHKEARHIIQEMQYLNKRTKLDIKTRHAALIRLIKEMKQLDKRTKCGIDCKFGDRSHPNGAIKEIIRKAQMLEKSIKCPGECKKKILQRDTDATCPCMISKCKKVCMAFPKLLKHIFFDKLKQWYRNLEDKRTRCSVFPKGPCFCIYLFCPIFYPCFLTVLNRIRECIRLILFFLACITWIPFIVYFYTTKFFICGC